MWNELGIAPCDDHKEIRRAYAARLKQLDPDRDPQAFARLRRALEWALDGAGGGDDQRSSRRSHATESADDLPPISRSEGEFDQVAPATEPASVAHMENAQKPELEPAPASDDDDIHDDDIRDWAVLAALDAALRRRDGNAATALYYRAAATGALSLAGAPDTLERLLAVAVDDRALAAADFRRLLQTAGLDAPRSPTPVDPGLRERLLARLRAEDWYDDLVAATQPRKGRAARRRRKIARLILGRIGRHWHPRVDKPALRTWLGQYRSHQAWLEDRIDPAWVSKLEGRLRRRDIFWLAFYGVLIGGLLLQFVHLSVVAVIDGTESLWALLIAPFSIVFLLWILKLILTELLTTRKQPR